MRRATKATRLGWAPTGVGAAKCSRTSRSRFVQHVLFLLHYSLTPRRARLRRSPRAIGAQTKICTAQTVRENSPSPHEKRKHVVRPSFRGSQSLFWGVLGELEGTFSKVPSNNPRPLTRAPRINRARVRLSPMSEGVVFGFFPAEKHEKKREKMQKNQAEHIDY